MNRERLLLVGVIAIVALWFFVLKEDVETAIVKPGTKKLSVADVKGTDLPKAPLPGPGDQGAFTLFTNETEYPRPDLAAIPEVTPRAYDLPNICPPTTYSVSVDRFGMLRRPGTPKPEGDAATLKLPALIKGDTSDDAEGVATVDRYDAWQSRGRGAEGRIIEIFVGGKVVREPAALPEPGEEALKNEFYRLLIAAENKNSAGVNAGITSVRARLLLAGKLQGTIKQRFPAEISNIKVCSQGRLQGFFDGMRVALDVENEKGFQIPFDKGRSLLERGMEDDDLALVKWALHVLEVARKNVPGKGAQLQRNRILLLMMEAASRLNLQERVLALAFEHLNDFPKEEEVLEYVGNIVGSRSFGLDDLAAKFYAMAPGNKFAQRRLIEKLIRLNRFDDAQSVLDSGRAGAGPEVDLLQARVALARGELDAAESRARNHTGGADKAQAHQILGAVEYTRGNMTGAAEQFQSAVDAAPGLSTAYSDLGMALAVQGRAADALLCFERAWELDRIDNIVAPRVGRAYLELTAGDYAAAATRLEKIQDDNPNEILVRTLLAYAKEKQGDLDEAAKLYRSTLDDDHRYRIAIARLGVVQSQRAERDGDAALAKEAVAHLKKAVDLNPKDAILPYILGRFLTRQKMQARLAKDMFGRAASLPGRAGADDKLPLWAKLGSICVDYRNEGIDESRIKGAINKLRGEIRDAMPGGMKEDELQKQHEVYRAATEALSIVQETQAKVNKTWTFPSKPRPPWFLRTKDPQKVAARSGRGLVYGGTIDYGGNPPGFILPLQYCAAEYTSKTGLTGRSFRELRVEGTIPSGTAVKFGIGLVNATRSKRKGPTGLQIRRLPRGTAEVRLDGGASEMWKKLKAERYVEFKKVQWPEGKFTLHIKTERGEKATREGRFRIWLNGVNIFEQEFGDATERSSVFNRSRGNQALSIFLWVEGEDGTRIPDINVSKVVLTKAKK